MRPWPAYSVLLTGTFLANLDVFIVVVAMPALRRDLGAGEGEQQLILAGYQSVYGLGLVGGGRLGDRCGAFRVFGAGMAVFTAASVGCGLAPSPGVLVAARLVQGAGTALLVPQVYAGAQTLFAGPDRRRAFAAAGAVMGVGAVGGQLLGGWLLSADPFGLGWRSVFLVNLPVGAVALTALASGGAPTRAPAPATEAAVSSGRPVPPAPSTAHAPGTDLPGTALAALALGLLVLPLVTANRTHGRGWTGLVPLLCLAAAPVAGLAFLRYERALQERGGQPLLPPELLRRPGFRRGLGLVALANCGLNAFILLLGLLLQQGLGWGPLATGAGILPPAAGFVAGSLLAPRLPLPDAGLLCGAAAASSAGYAGCVVSALSGDTRWLLGALAVVGFGLGLFVTPALAVTLRAVPAHASGTASGLVSTVQQLGAAVGVCVFGTAFFALVHARYGFPVAFAAGTTAIAVATACGGLLAIGVRPDRARATAAPSRTGRPRPTPPGSAS